MTAILIAQSAVLFFAFGEVRSVDPECQCRLFKSTGLSAGTFKSPNYRIPPLPALECLIYSFLGERDEIVKISFLEFNIPRSNTRSRSGSRCEDYVRVFNNVRHNSLNENDSFSYELCGSLLELPQRQFFSRYNRVMLELRLQPLTDAQDYGFLGQFRFEPVDRYKSDGVLVPGTTCDVYIMSKTLPAGAQRDGDSKRFGKDGHIRSPHYPQNYPPGTICRYYLIGLPRERVIITFEDLALPPADKYKESPHLCDRILLQEGQQDQQTNGEVQNESSSFAQIHPKLNPTKTIWSTCGEVGEAEIVSDGPNIILTFSSNADGQQNRGFSAAFRFVHRNQVKPTLDSGVEIASGLTDSDYQILDSVYDLRSEIGGVGVLQDTGHTSTPISGVLQSPNFPNAYPKNILQRHFLYAQRNSRIVLRFTTFQLDPQTSRSCTKHSGDRLELLVGYGMTHKLWRVLCGTRLSGLSETLSFQTRSLLIQFKSDNITLPTEKGYHLIYSIRNDSQSDGLQSTSGYSDGEKTDFYGWEGWMNSDQILQHDLLSSFDKNQTSSCVKIIRSVNRTATGIFQVLVEGSPEIHLQSCLKDRKFHRWTLEGLTGQRIRLELQSMLFHPPTERYGENEKAVGHNVIEGTGLLSWSTEDVPKKKTDRFSTVQIKCDTPYELEIQTFRWQSKPAGFLSKKAKPKTSREDGELGEKGPLLDKQSLTENSLQVGESTRVCLGNLFSSHDESGGFMSSSIPRIDVFLKTNQLPDHSIPVSGVDSFGRQKLQGLSVSVKYSFVTDYAVLAPFGYQRSPDCNFVFSSSSSREGNLSSPNYPNPYPVDIFCQYKLKGLPSEVIELNFTAIDLESSSSICSTDNHGDYIEVTACTRGEFLDMPKLRYCQSMPKHRPVVIRWNNPCMLIRFSSNQAIVRRGFFAVYRFHNSSLRVCGRVHFHIIMVTIILFTYWTRRLDTTTPLDFSPTNVQRSV